MQAEKRFLFLHAIDFSGEMSFWNIAKSCVRRNGRLYIEARTVNDTLKTYGIRVSNNESIFGHYRRFIKPSDLIKNARDNKFLLIYKVTGRGMARFHEEDPVVIRCTFEAV